MSSNSGTADNGRKVDEMCCLKRERADGMAEKT
eukprot:CAMPEP_0203945370 /NCGR_PEP_ID=MMETSP0359-20131031/80899_1 /ASSEMBLY_ACC=CAM_ASM_000338 /TAXON_ID=268821 /ORGANISM="Scrippsiella Hangoei, Strain SHTV-5" /LENGTH=32 /DNA_ID= /DNA_START= /DNA_END= /DNA_ORIENTATION=